jgi:hypothetical protein
MNRIPPPAEWLHQKRCLAAAVIAAIENLRDASPSDHGFVIDMQDNPLHIGAGYLLDGTMTCTCVLTCYECEVTSSDDSTVQVQRHADGRLLALCAACHAGVTARARAPSSPRSASCSASSWACSARSRWATCSPTSTPELASVTVLPGLETPDRGRAVPESTGSDLSTKRRGTLRRKARPCSATASSRRSSSR